jgi:hypothetical protein
MEGFSWVGLIPNTSPTIPLLEKVVHGWLGADCNRCGCVIITMQGNSVANIANARKGLKTNEKATLENCAGCKG